MKQKITEKRIVLIFCCVGLFLELFVFNYKRWESLRWQKQQVWMEEYLLGSGLEQVEPMVYRVTAEGEETATIEWLNINQKLYNLHVGLEILEPEEERLHAVNVQLKVTDAANARYLRLPARNILPGVPKSEYIRLHLSGETKEVLLILHASEGTLIRIHDISGNVHVPLFFSGVRMLTVTALLLAAYFLRPASKLHRPLYTEMTWRGRLLIGVLLCLQLTVCRMAAKSDYQTDSVEERYPYMRQYQLLAHSLAEGKTYLEVEPDEMIRSLSNPYDYRLRSMTMETEGGTYLWDAAYYNEKYYVYFGIVPELLFFLPYYLITGRDLPIIPVSVTVSFLFLAGVWAFMGALIRRWFPKTPFTVYLLLSILIGTGCGVLDRLMMPNLHDLPILTAMALGVWGLYFWIGSVRKDSVSLWRIGVGSFLLALISGCRPQLLLLLFLAVPVFREPLADGRLLQNQRIQKLLCFGLPILAVALGIMYYNFIRFGSVTDFGSRYNLTIQDMTHREMYLGRTVFGLFTIFFQPPSMTGVFPYFHEIQVKSQFYGQTIQEPGYGGIIATNLILLFTLIPGRFRRCFRDQRAYLFACLLIIFTGIAAFFDMQIGGLIPRYAFSVAWLLFLAAAVLMLAWNEAHQETAVWKTGYCLFLVLFIQCLLFQGLVLFPEGITGAELTGPAWIYQAEHLIEFWL